MAPDHGRRSRAQVVAAELEAQVLSAGLPVGTHLGRRTELMARFGVSPTVMNETLRILRDSGLVGVRRGNGGGVFVAGHPPQVRLGAIDLWFTPGGTPPLELFEARLHLERVLTPLAFDRRDDVDLDAMRAALGRVERARTAADHLAGVVAVHRALVAAAKVPVLDGMHQTVVALLSGRLSRAELVADHQEMLAHSRSVHESLVEAVAHRDRVAFDKLTVLHDDDLVRPDAPDRSPQLNPPPPGGAQ